MTMEIVNQRTHSLDAKGVARSRFHRVGKWVRVMLLCWVVAAYGCSAQSVTEPANSSDDANSTETTNDASNDRDNDSSQITSTRDTSTPASAPTEELWDAIYIGDQKVGYGHTTITPVVDNGRELLKIVQESKMTIKRGVDTTDVRVLLTSYETPEGKPVRFRSEHTAGPAPVVTMGQINTNKLLLETQTLGKAQTTEMDWPRDDCGGFFAIEQSLKKSPLKPGEERMVRLLMPVFNQICEARMEAVDYEETPMDTGTRDLLKINASVVLPQAKIDQVMWVDRTGETLKTLLPGLGQVTFRTTKEVALGKTEVFDLGKMSTVRVARRLDDPHATHRVVYKARIRTGDLKDVFAEGPTQSVIPLEDKSAEIIVRSIRPADPPKLEAPNVPATEDDLLPNNLIQSDDSVIKEMAADVATDEMDPWTIAVALEKHVHQIITAKNFSQAFATAAEVARTREGDCTEHGVLLAALCRARKIPARVAIGLVYYTDAEGPALAYHLWTEVWIKDRWVPLDATLGRGGIGAAHVKLADSNLKGATAYSAFLPVIQVIGQLEMEIVEAEYRLCENDLRSNPGAWN